MSDNKFLTFVIALGIAIGIASMVYMEKKNDDCAAKGGVLIQGRYGSTCVRKDAIIP